MLSRTALTLTSQKQNIGSRIIAAVVDAPDNVPAARAIQNAGGTTQGAANPTWLKQGNDRYVNAFAAVLAGAAGYQFAVGLYSMTTGTGKKEGQ